jgi:hypothetical protein
LTCTGEVYRLLNFHLCWHLGSLKCSSPLHFRFYVPELHGLSTCTVAKARSWGSPPLPGAETGNYPQRSRSAGLRQLQPSNTTGLRAEPNSSGYVGCICCCNSLGRHSYQSSMSGARDRHAVATLMRRTQAENVTGMRHARRTFPKQRQQMESNSGHRAGTSFVPVHPVHGAGWHSCIKQERAST